MSRDIREASLDSCRSWAGWFRVMVAERERRKTVSALVEAFRDQPLGQIAKIPVQNPYTVGRNPELQPYWRVWP